MLIRCLYFKAGELKCAYRLYAYKNECMFFATMWPKESHDAEYAICSLWKLAKMEMPQGEHQLQILLDPYSFNIAELTLVCS